MLKANTLTQEQISEINKVKIIRLIKENLLMTKRHLAKELELSHTTINYYIQTLINEGLVEVAGVAESTGGRKPLLIKLIPNARYSFGVNFTPEKIYVLLVEFALRNVQTK